MRKIILYINSTLNGIVTGDPGKDKTNFMVWTTESFIEAGSEVALKTLQTVDTILLGRKTYEDIGRQDKWPSVKQWPDVTELSLALGEKINNAHKLVVTRDRAHDEMKWGEYEPPQKITGDNIEEQIRNLKNSEGGDIAIFGSPTLVRALTDANLIDEFQILIRPVVVNVGEHLFDNLKDRKDLELVEVKPLKEGSVFVKYRLVQTSQVNGTGKQSPSK